MSTPVVFHSVMEIEPYRAKINEVFQLGGIVPIFVLHANPYNSHRTNTLSLLQRHYSFRKIDKLIQRAKMKMVVAEEHQMPNIVLRPADAKNRKKARFGCDSFLLTVPLARLCSRHEWCLSFIGPQDKSDSWIILSPSWSPPWPLVGRSQIPSSYTRASLRILNTISGGKSDSNFPPVFVMSSGLLPFSGALRGRRRGITG